MDVDLASQFESLFILLGMLLIPAIIILAVFIYLRKRRSSFRHKRRTSSSRH
jgi:hypothetical protein